MELRNFLLARIAEDEAAAQAATGGVWSMYESRGNYGTYDPLWGVKTDAEDGHLAVMVESDSEFDAPLGGCHRPVDAEHIARWDPARVLAECAAKRCNIHLHAPVDHDWVDADGDDRSAEFCRTCDRAGDPSDVWPCPTIRFLAMPYVDHPDFYPAWSAT